jgi:hypothetical protein
MRASRLLLVLAAFLVALSSVLTLYGQHPFYPVYVNIAAMIAIAAAVSTKRRK